MDNCKKSPFRRDIILQTILFFSVSLAISISAYSDMYFTATESSNGSGSQITAIQQQARDYRKLGLEAQQIGRMGEAKSYFQKAIELDPYYAPLYNDLGLVYELSGATAKAEKYYFKCLDMDPSYLNTYSNLAFLNENKGSIKKAAFYWRKRWELGDPADAWTQKARKRLEDIGMIDPDVAQELREEQVISLTKVVTVEKASLKEDDKAMAAYLLKRAKNKYAAERYVESLDEALSASHLDPSNSDIDKFVEQVQKRALEQ